MNKQKDAAYEFTKLGAESNAYTTFDKTIYYFSTADNIKKKFRFITGVYQSNKLYRYVN